MGMLSDLFHKIFPASHPASQGDLTASSQVAPPGSAAPMPSEVSAPPVDIDAVLTQMQAQAGQPLNWKTSIVDLLKLVGMDSSLASRKQLATELHYTGDTNDSATMNVWLHKQVMQKIAANGGKLPGGPGLVVGVPRLSWRIGSLRRTRRLPRRRGTSSRSRSCCSAACSSLSASGNSSDGPGSSR